MSKPESARHSTSRCTAQPPTSRATPRRRVAPIAEDGGLREPRRIRVHAEVQIGIRRAQHVLASPEVSRHRRARRALHRETVRRSLVAGLVAVAGEAGRIADRRRRAHRIGPPLVPTPVRHEQRRRQAGEEQSEHGERRRADATPAGWMVVHAACTFVAGTRPGKGTFVIAAATIPASSIVRYAMLRFIRSSP